jgi:hypothetical protein
VQIDAGVESDLVGRLEETHGKASGNGVMRREATSRPPPSLQARAFMSIQRLKLTGAALGHRAVGRVSHGPGC